MLFVSGGVFCYGGLLRWRVPAVQMVWYVLVPLVCFEGRADVALGMRGIIFSGGILIMREGGGLWIISEAIVTRRDSSFVTVQPSSAYVGRL